MGRRKLCDKLGKNHEYEFVFKSIGGRIKYGIDKGKTSYQVELKCKFCRHRTYIAQEVSGIWVYDPENSKLKGYRKADEPYEDPKEK